MKHFDIEITDSNNFKLLVLSDFHIGDENCDLNGIKYAIDYAKETDDCYVILNGDLMNNAIKTSKSDCYTETMTMEQEQDMLVKLLYPIKDKILVLSNGNHEYRTQALTGINPLRYVASELGITNTLCDGSYTITLSFGSSCGTNTPNKYLIYGTHGHGGGKKIGSTANGILELRDIVRNADLYIHSHTHKCISFKEPIYEITKRGLIEREQTFYNSNGFLKYGGYTERLKLAPVSTATSVLDIKALRTHDKGMRIVTDIIRI